MDIFYTVCRYLSVIEGSAVVLLALLQVQFLGGWPRLNPSDRFRLSGGALLAGAAAYGAIETLVTDVPGGLRTVLSTVALGYLGLGYWMILKSMYTKRDR